MVCGLCHLTWHVVVSQTNLLQCHALRALYLYDNGITEIKGIPATVTHLHLQNNNIQRLENLGHLKQLSKLFVAQGQVRCRARVFTGSLQLPAGFWTTTQSRKWRAWRTAACWRSCTCHTNGWHVVRN